MKVLLALACAYGLSVSVHRDSCDVEVTAAWKRVVKRAHPDKGGSTEDAQRLQAAKEAWDAAREEQGQPGRPKKTEEDRGRAHGESKRSAPAAGALAAEARVFRIHSEATMLTYNGITDVAQWRRLVAFVESHLKPWQVLRWCATLEQSSTGRLHAHVYLQFRRQVDRTSRSFAFEGIAPRADPNDLCGEGLSRKKLQDSINRLAENFFPNQSLPL
mgnify:CR=1 FL=1